MTRLAEGMSQPRLKRARWGAAVVALILGGSATSATPALAATSLSWGAPTPVSDPGNGPLQGISCASATFCASIDLEGNLLTYNGSSWSAPVPGGPDLPTAISCTNSAFCMVLDAAGNARQWSGDGWSAPTNILQAFDVNHLSCVTSSFCVAVDGDAGDTETFDGSGWSPAASSPIDVQALACATTTFCEAVGGDSAVSFDGTTWSAPDKIDPGESLASVACPNAHFCLAADTGGDPNGRSQAFTYDGSTWSAPGSTGRYQVDQLSCASATMCVGVGDFGLSLATFDGSTWSTSDAPENIQSISCTAQPFCAAISPTGDESNFDGSAWSGPSLIDPAGGTLIDLSCTSPTFCIAADTAGNVVSFDGSQWSTAHHVDAFGGGLVSCSSPTACVLIARDGADAWTYNGTTWSGPTRLPEGANPFRFAAFVPMSSLSCVSGSFCVAVGAQSIAYTFNGTSWSASGPVTGTGSDNRYTTAVSCASTAFCMAVAQDGSAAHFDGTTWSTPDTVDSQSPSGVGSNAPAEVSCPTATNCVATFANGKWARFDGTGWSAPAPIDPSLAADTLISCPSATLCAALESPTNANSLSAYAFDGATWSAATRVFDGNPWDGWHSVISCPTAGFCMALDPSANSVAVGRFVATQEPPTAPTSVSPSAGDSLATVSWAAPSDDGGSPITGYDVQYSTDGGTTWASASSAFHTSPATTQTVTGLTNDVSYVFRVAAINAAGTGAYSTASAAVTPHDSGSGGGGSGGGGGGGGGPLPPSPTPTVTPSPTQAAVTLTSGPNLSLVIGQHATISATLSSAAGPVSGETVRLLGRAAGDGAWTTFRTLAADAQGHVSTTIGPSVDAEFEWVCAGDQTHSSATSAVQLVSVRQAVSAHPTAHDVRAGHTVRIFGIVAPSTIGEVVNLERRSLGSWVTVRTAEVHRQQMPDGTIKVGYLFAFLPHNPRSVALRVSVAATPTNGPGQSPSFSLIVH